MNMELLETTSITAKRIYTLQL